jgi:hypothetical protein
MYFFYWRAPQQILQTHRSLEGLFCNHVIQIMFFLLSCFNGAPVKWNWQRKTELIGENNFPNVTLSTTNPTWTDPGLRSESRATNRLSHGTAYACTLTALCTMSLCFMRHCRCRHRFLSSGRALLTAVSPIRYSTPYYNMWNGGWGGAHYYSVTHARPQPTSWCELTTSKTANRHMWVLKSWRFT